VRRPCSGMAELRWHINCRNYYCVCIFLRMLQGSADVNSVNDGGPQFAEVFVIYWLGASVVTLNIKLLGGSMYGYYSLISFTDYLFKHAK